MNSFFSSENCSFHAYSFSCGLTANDNTCLSTHSHCFVLFSFRFLYCILLWTSFAMTKSFFVVRFEMLSSRQWNDDDDDGDIRHLHVQCIAPGCCWGLFNIHWLIKNSTFVSQFAFVAAIKSLQKNTRIKWNIQWSALHLEKYFFFSFLRTNLDGYQFSFVPVVCCVHRKHKKNYCQKHWLSALFLTYYNFLIIKL